MYMHHAGAPLRLPEKRLVEEVRVSWSGDFELPCSLNQNKKDSKILLANLVITSYFPLLLANTLI